ncbi:MAG: HTTM domain-containing protein [Acidimicrobiales bacterium]|nr:HTTM domain-containing protein [Acidimicrobiales bacterium]
MTQARDAATSAWDRFLFEPRSTSPAALLRIGWGILATLWALTLLPDVDPLLEGGALGYERPLPTGSWNLLELTSWDGAPLAMCLLLVLVGITTTVGYQTRLSTAVAVVCMVCLQRQNTTIINSGDLMLRQVGIALALTPAGLLLSVDEIRQRRRGRAADRGAADRDGAADSAEADRGPLRAPWALRLLQLELAVGYFLSCWAKLRGSTWHEGTALGLALRIEDLQRFAAPEWLYDQEILLNLLTWGTLLFEGAFLFAVWSRRLRPWVLWIGVAFHVGIDLLFDVGFFSLTMLVAYLAFLPPETADDVVAWLRRRLGPGPTADPVTVAGRAADKAQDPRAADELPAQVPLAVEPPQ